MEAFITIQGIRYRANLHHPVDISIPLVPDATTPNAYFAPPFRVEPVRMGNFVGDTRLGGAVNFVNVMLNPHGNGTHTECYGHISTERVSLHHCLRQFHFSAKLISILPVHQENGDRMILAAQLAQALAGDRVEAVVIRSLPNHPDKAQRSWSGTNPVYLDPDGLQMLVDLGVRHILVDLPSVDREEDGGKLAAHHVWWGYPDHIRKDATITEMIFVPEEQKDGLYLLNLQIPSFVLDAGPSKPVLFPLIEVP
ncbi:MAG: cyclase family protein [Saprospiraceae bacterium]|nr:cyclase family protein [Saprospiraceae bacterium]